MTKGPFGAGSQFGSLSLPGDSFWIERQAAVGVVHTGSHQVRCLSHG